MSLIVKVHNELRSRVSLLECPFIEHDADTKDLVDGDPTDSTKPSGVEVNQISRVWDDSPNMLVESPRDTVQWLWRVRLLFPKMVDTQPIYDAFETPTHIQEDAVAGTPRFRISLVETQIEDAPASSSTGTSMELTLDVVPIRR